MMRTNAGCRFCFLTENQEKFIEKAPADNFIYIAWRFFGNSRYVVLPGRAKIIGQLVKSCLLLHVVGGDDGLKTPHLSGCI
jgi:hypothetical protein